VKQSSISLKGPLFHGGSDQPALSVRILRSSQRRTFPYNVRVNDRQFVVLRNVFSPRYFGSTELFSAWLGSLSLGDLLEVGTGTGVTGILAVFHGAARSALLVDINPDAVRNARMNVQRYGLGDKITCRASDIFSTVKPSETFDSIYWNMPFIWRPQTYRWARLLDRSLFDPGYRQTERFLRQARRHLRPGGRLLIGFGTFGDAKRLSAILTREGWIARCIGRQSSTEGARVEFELFEVSDDRA
jgi:release factor glutamine methyltransferase